MTLRIGALIGGGGRTVLNLADEIEAGRLPAVIATVIASRPDLAGVGRAESRGLPVRVVARKDFDAEDEMHDAISRTLDDAGVDLVCLCGYLRLVRIDEHRVGKVMNIHPALLPDFGGRGMYGDRVHAGVLAAGRSYSGCTVHFVDEQYDHGPVILQRTCPVLAGDTVEALAARVFDEERRAFPEAIGLFAAGRLRIREGRVEVWPG